MKLTDKRFWIWCFIIALMPIMMSLFAVIVLLGISGISELFFYKNIELFMIWELTYFLGGLLQYRKMQSKNWWKSSLLCWITVCPFLCALSFLWVGFRIHDGLSGLAYFMISCISWGISILPLLFGVYVYKKSI